MKKWWKSKTMWVNIATGAAAVGAAVAQGNVISNPETLKLVLLGVAIVNIILRLVTSTAIVGSQQQPPSSQGGPK